MSGAQIFQVQQPTVQIIPPKKVSKVLSVITMVGSAIGIALFLYGVQAEGGFDSNSITFIIMTFLWILGIALVSSILTVIASCKPVPSLGVAISALVFVCLNITISTVLLVLTIPALASCSYDSYYGNECLSYGLLVGGIILIWIAQILAIVVGAIEVKRSSPGTSVPQMLYLVTGNSSQPQAVALDTISSISTPVKPSPSYTIAAPESDDANAPLVWKN